VLTNNGNFTWTQGIIILGNGGIFNNSVTGVITATGDDAMNSNCCAVEFNNAGIFTKSAGTGTTSLNVNGSNSGTINVNSGTIKSSGSFANSGTISIATGKTFLVNGGAFSLNNGSNTNGVGKFQFSAGTIIVNADAATPATATNYLFTAGTMNGSGTLNVVGGMEWQSGSIQLAKVQLAAGSNSSKTTTGVSDVNNGVLTNNGNFTWAQGNIILGNFGIFNNSVTGVITATGDDAMTANCCTVAFNNAGIFTKSISTGTTSIGVDGSNSGTINVNSGIISSSGSFANSGTINVASGKTFLVNGGAFSLNNGSISNGAGSFQFSSGTIKVNADAATPATATNYLFSGGTMSGNGTLNVVGGMEWQSGSMAANVQLAAGSVSSKTTTGTSDLNGRVLTNNGNFTWTQGIIILGNGGIFNNSVTGVITATGDDAMTANCCVVAFNNAGTFIKNPGLGTTTLGAPVTNAGIIKGIGTLNFTNTFASDGFIAPGNSPGMLTINGTQPFSANSTLQIEIKDGSGPGTGHDQLQRNSNLTLAGTLTVTETGTVLPGVYTIINLSSGTISGNFNILNLPPCYTVQVTTSTVTVTKALIPETPIIIQNAGNLSTSANGSLQWFLNGQPIAGATGVSFTPVLSGPYTVTVTSGGCSATSSAFVVVSIVSLEESIGLKLYPNPVQDVLHFHSDVAGNTFTELFDLRGMSLLNESHSTQDFNLEINRLPTGMYILKIKNEKGFQSIRITKN